jgi:diguanylate cyclase (GGDEF)-like protein/PAS domain S-box-containing protein
VFEWNLKENTIYFSHKWEERFGYEPVSRNFGAQLGIAAHFHPDDLPMVREAIEEVRTRFTSMCADVRIADANARYLWNRVIATPCLNEVGELVRIIGILQDVDAVKRAEEKLKEKAERDGLTKLYNKASVQKLITEYLAGREESSLSAMLILDLDNFKLINDNYGHLYGDSVLEQISAGLRSLFRSNDIVGRIGGDEFLILMKDIPNTELVHSRCRRLLGELHRMLEERCPGLDTSGSVGVVLIPDHGTGYSDLFRRADEALYHSKIKGKDTRKVERIHYSLYFFGLFLFLFCKLSVNYGLAYRLFSKLEVKKILFTHYCSELSFVEFEQFH